jgi:hypothetical protein
LQGIVFSAPGGEGGKGRNGLAPADRITDKEVVYGRLANSSSLRELREVIGGDPVHHTKVKEAGTGMLWSGVVHLSSSF